MQELQGGTPSANLLTGRLDGIFHAHRLQQERSTILQDALGSTSDRRLGTEHRDELYVSAVRGDDCRRRFAGTGNNYQFAGHENDSTGLYSYRSRYYSPTFQRFIAQDPIGSRGGDINLYAYVKNSPVDLTI